MISTPFSDSIGVNSSEFSWVSNPCSHHSKRVAFSAPLLKYVVLVPHRKHKELYMT